MRFLIGILILTLCGCGGEEAVMTDGKWESAFAEANGVRIHYWRTGGEKPVIVMSHGITDSGLDWSSLAKALEADYDVIMYDARGHGLSDKPETGYSIENHVADLKGLVDALGIASPILMGHSMGGAIVARTAAMYPGLPKAVILEDPVHMEQRPEMDAERKAEIEASRREAIVKRQTMTREQIIEQGRTEAHPGWREEDYGPWADSKLQVSPNIAPTYTSMPSLRDSFPKITAPTLILKADADGATRAKNAEVAALLPDGKIVHIDGAGHNIRRDKPEETLAEVRTFLNSIR